MKYSSKEILEITGARLINKSLNINDISSVEYDTRKIFNGSKALFVAFLGNNTDGHKFIANAYEKGVRNFMISEENLNLDHYAYANFFLVEDPYLSIQKIAGNHRKKQKAKVISITGSNGKTIVKEWLSQCLSRTKKVVKSPVSFNSQLGVALSLLLIEEDHDFAIIEAGISAPNQMENLEKIIKPQIGILTNIGDAHSVGFKNKKQKLSEKLKLFTESEKIIANIDDKIIIETLSQKFVGSTFSTWSSSNSSAKYLVVINKHSDHALIEVKNSENFPQYKVPFNDDASLENIIHVILTLTELGIDTKEIQAGILSLDNLPMRLELKEGLHECLILDDSYSFDIESLKIGVKELYNNANGREKSIIISDLDDQNASIRAYQQIVKILSQVSLKKLIVIGTKLHEIIDKQNDVIAYERYESAADFLSKYDLSLFQNEIILVKGARRFTLDSISKRISARRNKTILEIDLFALSENIDYFRNNIPRSTGLMAVLKASAYGSGTQHLSAIINNKSIDILAVAIIEEAIEMRKAGVKKDILIFNPHPDSLDLVSEYDFEIELSNKSMANALISFVERNDSKIKIHLKLDTGMNRLGFKENDFSFVSKIINHSKIITKAIFSHLAASDDLAHDDFSKSQLALFSRWYKELTVNSYTKPLRHVLNSSGALRFPNYQYDYVRVGLGLYGLDLMNQKNNHLTKVHSLKSYIVQIKDVNEGETVGYGNNFKLEKSARIAIIGIGYADGLMRLAGSKSYKMVVKGQKAPLIGNICMDLCMLDISELEGISEGDEVLIFGKNHPIEVLSEACETIPYEILTRVAPRVKRLYIQ